MRSPWGRASGVGGQDRGERGMAGVPVLGETSGDDLSFEISESFSSSLL